MAKPHMDWLPGASLDSCDGSARGEGELEVSRCSLACSGAERLAGIVVFPKRGSPCKPLEVSWDKREHLSSGGKSFTIPYTTFHVQTLTPALSVHQKEYVQIVWKGILSGSTRANPWLK